MEGREWDNYAKEYHSHIVSPFQEDVKNPIFKDLDKVTKNQIVADIGTGQGDFIPFLAENFKFVFAIDFSKEMLKKAKENNSYKNVKYILHDIRKLSELNLKLDMAIAVNSILHPSVDDVDKSLKEILKSLKEGGLFIGIFPSMEAIIHQFQLVYTRERKKFGDEKKALAMTKRIVERKKYNVIMGIYEDDGEKQKFYYRFELRNRLKEAGFKNIRFKKVKYPWGESQDYEDFPEAPEMWDWYAICEK